MKSSEVDLLKESNRLKSSKLNFIFLCLCQLFASLNLTSTMLRAVVMAQLVEQLLPTPKICSSNPVIGQFYVLSTVLNQYLKDANKQKKRPGISGQNGHFLHQSRQF